MTKTISTKAPSCVKLAKEEVINLTFSNDDVLLDKVQISKRRIDLQRAQALGAQSKSNIKIYVTDFEGRQYLIEATVWAATEKNVTLKGGVLIPNRSINKVGFF